MKTNNPPQTNKQKPDKKKKLKIEDSIIIGVLKSFHGAVPTVITETIAEILQQQDTEKRIKENMETLA